MTGVASKQGARRHWAAQAMAGMRAGHPICIPFPALASLPPALPTCGKHLQHQDEVHQHLDAGPLEVEHQQQALGHEGERQEGLRGPGRHSTC